MAQASEYAGADGDELAERVDEDGQFADVLAAAAEKAVSVGDELMRESLARLVAAAFRDDAATDKIAFLIGMATQLDPIHLRVLKSLSGRLDGREHGDIEREANADPPASPSLHCFA